MSPKESKPKVSSTPPKEGSGAHCAAPIEISSELLTALQVRFKLTESQSRVYTVLLVMGQLTADEVSNYSGIPIVKVMSTIETLEKKQLIKSLPGVVARYRAFAPYKELADEVKAFSKDTQKSWKDLQKLQTKTLGEIHDELQLMTRQTRSALENLNERQGIALNEAAMTTNIVLNNVAENLQKSMTDLSETSENELTRQASSFLSGINNLIDEEIGELALSQKQTLDDTTKSLERFQEETQQWISSTASNLLDRTTSVYQQAKTHLEDVDSQLQQNIDAGIKTVEADITSQKEAISELTEEIAVTLTNDVDSYTKETQLAIDVLQKENNQALGKYNQEFSTLLRNVWTNRVQELTNLISQLDKTIKKENRRIVQQTNKAATSMDTTIKTSRDTSIQIIETLFQDLKKTQNHSSLELQRVYKEAEATIKKWPPASLSFSQFSKIKTSLSTLMEQVKTEHDLLLESASQDIGIELRDTYLAQLLEVQTLLQGLIKTSKTQQKDLTTKFKSVSDQIGRRLKRRLRTIQKTAEAFLTDFQTKITIQEEQQRTLSKQMQKILNTEASTAITALEQTEVQLRKYAETQLKYAQSNIQQSAVDSRTQASRDQKTVEKQTRAFKAALTKIKNQTTSELQKELSKLEKIVRQYSEGVESTADKLRDEQILKVENVIRNYQPANSEIQTTRDRAISRAFRTLKTQLTKRNQLMVGDLFSILSEDVPTQALTALNDYQANLQRKISTVENQALTATEGLIAQQFTPSDLKSINTSIVKTLDNQVEAVSMNFQESVSKQEKLQRKQSDTAFNLARDEFIDVYGQQIEKYNEAATLSFNSRIKPILRDYKTKISRQTKRENQIDKLYQATLEKIKAVPKTVLAKEKKAVRDKLTKELESIFQTFRTQLKKQTNREKQIAAIYKSSIEKFELVPSTLLSELSEQHLENQITNLLAIFVEYQSAIDRQQLTNRKQLTTEFQSLVHQIPKVNYANAIKPQISSLLKKSIKDAIEAYRTKISNEQVALEVQAEAAFQTALEKSLRSQIQPKFREYSTTQAPTLNEPVDKLSEKIGNTISKFDSNSRALVEKYWLPLTKIIDDYSSAVAANLTALNTATGTAIDQSTVSVTASLTNFDDDSTNLLTTTVQAFDREKSMINEQTLQGITQMQEDCVSQLQETQGLLDSLSADIVTQKTETNKKIKTMASEIDNTTIANLEAISEVATSFVENVQTELQTQEARVENLKKNVQDLILKQGAVLGEGVGTIRKELESFSNTQIPKAQKIIEEIGQSCTTRIDDQRSKITQILEAFGLSLSEETEDYVSTLQQELVQLQTVISKLVEKIGATGETIDTELVEQMETSKVNLLNAVDAQQTNLSSETSAFFQTLAEQSRAHQTQLLDNLQEVAEEGKEALDQNQAEINTSLENTVNQTLSNNEKTFQTLSDNLKTTTQNIITQFGENLSTFGEKMSSSTEHLLDSLRTTLINSKKELGKQLSESGVAIDNANQSLETQIGQEVEKALQDHTKALDLTESRLSRATTESIRRITENLNNFKSSTSTELEQKSTAIVATVNQVLENAKEGLVTQTQQTGRRISRTLSKERQTLKTEYQNLAKEITTRAKTAETTAVNTLQLFSAQTEPTLDRLRTQAAQTQEILIGLWDTLTKMEPAEAERTWRIVTCEGIQNHLLDMFRRVDETITLVYPSFDEVPITELGKIQPQNRVHIITTLDGEKQLSSAQKLLQQGNIRIWNNPNMEFYGGSRDGQEVLIAPTYGNQGEIVAVVSDQDSYIALFNQTLGPRWISASNEIRIRT